MIKLNLNIWGRKRELEVTYDCYPGEEILEAQREALREFLKHTSALFPEAEEKIKAYCLKRDRDDIGADSIENIFKYVGPCELYIPRTTDGTRVVALMCLYRFDEDDGVAAVFTNETLTEVGPQNIIL